MCHRAASFSGMSWNLADLFEQVADAIGDRTAVVVNDGAGTRRAYTMAELDERATRLAHVLADAGVGHNDKVGVYGYNTCLLYTSDAADDSALV